MNRYPEGAGGACRSCKTVCLYTQSTCDNCGDPLPWAAGLADQMGDKCPHCAAFNLYARSMCVECDEQLPWHECSAARYHAARNAKKRMRSLMLTIVLTVVGVVCFMSYMIVALRVHH